MVLFIEIFHVLGFELFEHLALAEVMVESMMAHVGQYREDDPPLPSSYLGESGLSRLPVTWVLHCAHRHHYCQQTYEFQL